MQEDLKEKMIIQCIKNYKNKDFSDDEILEKYSLAIQYMKDNFADLFENSVDFTGIQSIKEGERSITYKNNDANSLIERNDILKSLLGGKFMRLF